MIQYFVSIVESCTLSYDAAVVLVWMEVFSLTVLQEQNDILTQFALCMHVKLD